MSQVSVCVYRNVTLSADRLSAFELILSLSTAKNIDVLKT